MHGRIEGNSNSLFAPRLGKKKRDSVQNVLKLPPLSANLKWWPLTPSPLRGVPGEQRNVWIRIRELTFLCQRNPVVFQENDFELVSHHRIVVHHISHRRDELDDEFRHVIPGSSLQGGQCKVNSPIPKGLCRSDPFHSLHPVYLPTDDHSPRYERCSGVLSDPFKIKYRL